MFPVGGNFHAALFGPRVLASFQGIKPFAHVLVGITPVNNNLPTNPFSSWIASRNLTSGHRTLHLFVRTLPLESVGFGVPVFQFPRGDLVCRIEGVFSGKEARAVFDNVEDQRVGS
jgi:hypothetical protein